MNENTRAHDFSQLLARAQAGDRQEESRFCELVNAELRRAAACLVRGKHGVAQPTSLVNEVFVRLFRKGVVEDLKNRRYFFAVAIAQLRQTHRERYRRRKSQRQGGHLERQPLEIVLDHYLDDFEASRQFEFLMLDEALERLQNGSATARQYEIIRLHYFLGWQQKEIAETLDVHQSVVSKDLKAVLAKLAVELKGDA